MKYICIKNYFLRGNARKILIGEILTLQEILDIQWRTSQNDMEEYFIDLAIYREKRIDDILK